MTKIKITFFDSKQYDIDFFQKKNEHFSFHLNFIKEHININNLQLAYDSDVICLFVNDNLSEELINLLYANNVKLIALRCAGYNNIDLKAAYKNINVVRVPEYSPYAVAEHTMALILTLNRKTHRSYFRTRDNNFTLNGLLGFDLHAKTAGVIGTGKIGKQLISILSGFEMNILAYDLFPKQELVEKFGITYVDLDELYSKSDIISLNCPLTKDSFHMIDEKSISKMKDGVMIINTGRGKLINTNDLIEGLKRKKIGSAGLDVYEEESEYFFEDFSNSVLNDDTLARLLTFNNVLVTSHQAFFTKEALQNIAMTTLQNIQDFFDNKPLKNEICYRCCQNNCTKKDTGRCF